MTSASYSRIDDSSLDKIQEPNAAAQPIPIDNAAKARMLRKGEPELQQALSKARDLDPLF